jgi:hypothetical protein
MGHPVLLIVKMVGLLFGGVVDSDGQDFEGFDGGFY